MKKSIILLAAVTAMVCLWPSCTQIEETGDLQFGLELTDDSVLKSAEADQRVTAALVTIVGANGEMIYEKEHLPIYKFGTQYTTKSLKLPLGEYSLQEFMLIDSMGVVLWATPMEGSNLAHLVRRPLPIPFVIGSEETTSLDIQVIRVRNHPPSDFGYVDFNIGFVDRFCLKVFYSSRCLEEWPDGVMAPVHQPLLTIWARDRMVLQEPLNAGLNRFTIPLVAEWFHVTATDCHGQVIYEQKLPLEMLMKHRCGDNFEPLVIHRDPLPGIIITPEGLWEPTIRQGVFGRVQLPIDWYMLDSLNADGTIYGDGNMNDSIYAENADIWPVIRDIYFYPYSVLESIQTFAPLDCYFPADALGIDPVAVVRTNSDGIFQVPLDQGDYLYLVKDGDRYYMNPYMSSQRPGYVKVYPGEVTQVEIQIVDCSMWM